MATDLFPTIGSKSLDKDISMAQGFDIMGVPVLVKMANGWAVNRVVGYAPDDQVRAFAAE